MARESKHVLYQPEQGHFNAKQLFCNFVFCLEA